MGWNIDTVDHLIRLLPIRQAKVEAALKAIPSTAHTTSLLKWCKLLGLLRSITPSVAVYRGMFTQVQHSLVRAAGGNVYLILNVQNELDEWSNLVFSLSRRPTHLCKLQPFPPTWIGMTNELSSGMGGVCQDPEGQYFFGVPPFPHQPRHVWCIPPTPMET